MSTTELKVKLHEKIEQGDERLLKMLYALIQEYYDTEAIDDARKRLITAERERYLRGEGVSYSWEDVKKMAKNHQKPNRA